MDDASPAQRMPDLRRNGFSPRLQQFNARGYEMICDHELSEMETACVDGMCPLCMSVRLKRADAEIVRLRERERKIIDETWGEALEDGSFPSTKLQDKIIAAADAHQQSSLSKEPK